MSEDIDNWLPMSEDFHSIRFNSYCNGQTAAHMPLRLLPSFGSAFHLFTSEALLRKSSIQLAIPSDHRYI